MDLKDFSKDWAAKHSLGICQIPQCGGLADTRIWALSVDDIDIYGVPKRGKDWIIWVVCDSCKASLERSRSVKIVRQEKIS